MAIDASRIGQLAWSAYLGDPGDELTRVALAAAAAGDRSEVVRATVAAASRLEAAEVWEVAGDTWLVASELSAGDARSEAFAAAARARRCGGRHVDALEYASLAARSADTGVGRGRALVELGLARLALETPDAAAPPLTAALQGGLDNQTAATAHVALAECALAGTADLEAAAELLRRARAGLPGHPDAATVARGDALAQVLAARDRTPLVHRQWQQATRALERLGGARSVWRLTVSMATVLARTDNGIAALDLLDALSRRGDADEGLLAPTRVARARIALTMGRTVEADVDLERAVSAARAAGDRVGLIRSLDMACDVAATLGQPHILSRRLHERASLTADVSERLTFLARALRALAVAGDADEGHELALKLADAIDTHGWAAAPDVARLQLVEDVRDAGLPGRARELALAAARDAYSTGHAEASARALASAAELTRDGGDPALGLEMLEEAIAMASHYAMGEGEGWARTREHWLQ